MTFIDSALNIPNTIAEKKYKRQIAAIDAATIVFDAEENKPPLPRASHKHTADAAEMPNAVPLPNESVGLHQILYHVDRPHILWSKSPRKLAHVT